MRVQKQKNFQQPAPNFAPFPRPTAKAASRCAANAQRVRGVRVGTRNHWSAGGAVEGSGSRGGGRSGGGLTAGGRRGLILAGIGSAG